MKAFYAGSFSPPTMGHLDVIARAAAMFDEVIAAIMINPEKTYLFSPDVRREMIEKMTAHLPNVRVIIGSGLTVQLAREQGADVLLRAVRDEMDMAYEMRMARANRRLDGMETIFLAASAEYADISSTIVNDIARHGGRIDGMVPPAIAEAIMRVFSRLE